MANNWELGRFLDTLRFFQTLPFVGTLEPLRPVLAPLLPDLFKPPAYRGSGLVVVMGATARTGQAVVKTLLGSRLCCAGRGARSRQGGEGASQRPFFRHCGCRRNSTLACRSLAGQSSGDQLCRGKSTAQPQRATPPALKLSVLAQRPLNLRACGICWNAPNPIFKINPTPIPSLTIAIQRPP